MRTYPWWLQLMLFALMVLTFSSFTVVILNMIVPALTGYSLNTVLNPGIHSSKKLTDWTTLSQAIGNFGVYGLTALLFAYLTHPRAAEYLGIKKPEKSIQWVLIIPLAISAIPLSIGLMSLCQELHWHWADVAEKNRNNVFEPILKNMSSPMSLVGVITAFAIVPALSEELFFRGIIMRFAKKRSKGMVFPLLVSAIMFALAHSSGYEFISIFLMGILLGLIYYWTKSILCSMLFHFLNNGVQVALSYAAQGNAQIDKAINENTVPIFTLLGAGAIFLISFYLLWKNRTPLPADWAVDFTQEELSEKGL